MTEEGVVRESLPDQAAEPVEDVDPLGWTDDELKALTGEADAEAAETTPLRAVPPTDDSTSEDSGEGVPTGEAEGAATEDADDPSKFIDTRERKESYTPEEWGRLVRQRDYFQRTNQELKDEITTVSERVEKIGDLLTAKDAPPPADKADDPAGYLEEKISATDEKIDKVATSLEDKQKADELVNRQVQFEQASTYAQSAHLQATGQKPEDFVGKLQALRKDRYEDFLDEGYSEPEARNLTIGWEQTMIVNAFKRGENPAAVLDRRFTRRGLKPILPQAGQEAEGDQQQPRPGPPGPSAQEIVDRAKEGTKTTPVPRGEGNPRSFKVTYDTLASMDPEDFEEVMSQIEGTSKEDELDMTGSTSIVLR